MAIYKVQNVKLVGQPKSALCWYASARMLYLWSQKTGKGSMSDPKDESNGYGWRIEKNVTVNCCDNTFLASKMGMVTHSSISMDYSSLVDFMSVHGPIFTSLYKNWTANKYGHAVVIGGAATTGVFIYDPMPVGYGSSCWLTWNQINSAIDDIAGEANPSFLTAA